MTAWRAPLVAGISGSVALGLVLPTVEGDPLRSVLVALPLAAALFVLLERQGRHLGGRALPDGMRRIEAFALLALTVAGVLAPRLGLGSDLVAAGLALLLVQRVARQSLAWQRLLAGDRERLSVVFLLLPLAFHLLVLVWTHPQRAPDGDGPWYLLVAHSIWEDRDLDLTDEYADDVSLAFVGRALEPQPGDPVGEGGQQWSRHAPFLPFLLAVPLGLGGVLGVRILLTLLAAFLAWRGLALARSWNVASSGSLLLAWIPFAFGPPLLFYASQVWVEVPAALLVVLALEAMRRPRRRWALAIALLCLPLLKLRLAPIAVGLLLVALRHRLGGRMQPRRLLAPGLTLLGGLFALLALNRWWLGHLLGLHRPEEIFGSVLEPGKAALGFIGLALDSSFGLLPAAPIWVLALLGLTAAHRRSPGLLLDAALVGLPYLALLAPRVEWFGGWSPPFRYPFVLLPLLLPLLALGIDLARRRRGRWLFVTLVVPTVLLTVLWIARPGWTWNFAEGRSHILDTASLHLQADVARLFPSTIRPRLATWTWLAMTLAVPFLGRLRGPRTARGAIALGLCIALGFAVLVPLAASRLPTRIVEAEDPWVRRDGGALAPERWWPQRVLQPGGWLLEPGTSLTAPLRPGGTSARITLDVIAFDGPVSLTLRVGETEIASPVITTEEWHTVEIGTAAWDSDAPLQIMIPAGGRGSVIVDRVRLDWS